MSVYSIALFLHIVGALVLFALLAIEGFSLRQGIAAARANRVLGPISAVLILVPGLYMTATSWGWRGWILVSLATYLLIAVLGAFTGIRLMTGRLDHRVATVSWLVRVGMALGVVFIMTVKPSAAGAVVGVAIGALLGGATSLAARQVRSA
jgi:hypothetical protein